MKTFWMWTWLLSSSLLPLFAQEGPPARRPRGPRVPPGEEQITEPRRPSLPPAERYLRRMQERSPEEFEEMRRLREEDPEAFRQALRERFMQNRPADASSRPHPLQAEMAALQAAETPEEIAEAEAALRTKVGEWVDRRLQQREQRIEQVRKQLRELEAQHAEDTQSREAMIDRAMLRIRNSLNQGEEPEHPPLRP